MSAVVVYGFEGEYIGRGEYEYAFPQLGEKHRCMLFFFQESDASDLAAATRECEKYGFRIVSIHPGNPLKVEVMNTDSFKGFTGFYEEALEDGSSLVYYPNT